MIGASAIAGAVGAGGLGDMAIRYGYQRFDTTVMLAVIIVLIATVCIVNSLAIPPYGGCEHVDRTRFLKRQEL